LIELKRWKTKIGNRRLVPFLPNLRPNRSRKALWVYPLLADFRRKLNPAADGQ
jgi:hypothetical protein